MDESNNTNEVKLDFSQALGR